MQHTSPSLLPASLFLRPAGVGRLIQLDGGAGASGVDRCLLSESNGDLKEGVDGPLEGGRLWFPGLYEVPSESLLSDLGGP